MFFSNLNLKARNPLRDEGMIELCEGLESNSSLRELKICSPSNPFVCFSMSEFNDREFSKDEYWRKGNQIALRRTNEKFLSGGIGMQFRLILVFFQI